MSAKQIVEEEEKVQTWSDGSVFSGSFQNGHRHGRGEATWPNGEVHLGAIPDDWKFALCAHTFDGQIKLFETKLALENNRKTTQSFV